MKKCESGVCAIHQRFGFWFSQGWSYLWSLRKWRDKSENKAQKIKTHNESPVIKVSIMAEVSAPKPLHGPAENQNFRKSSRLKFKHLAEQIARCKNCRLEDMVESGLKCVRDRSRRGSCRIRRRKQTTRKMIKSVNLK